MQALKYLRHILRSTFTNTAKAQIPSSVRQEMEAVLQYFLTYHLERSLNSPAFIREVRRLDNSYN
jgi:DNA repair protein RecO (recombination protein O)